MSITGWSNLLGSYNYSVLHLRDDTNIETKIFRLKFDDFDLEVVAVPGRPLTIVKAIRQPGSLKSLMEYKYWKGKDTEITGSNRWAEAINLKRPIFEDGTRFISEKQ